MEITNVDKVYRYTSTWLPVSLLWLAVSPHAPAQECGGYTGEKCTTLPHVLVTSSEEKSATGVQSITEERIAELPTGAGNLADLMKINPAVDVSRHGKSSASSAVMRPEEFSFHGQPFYQNLFMIDGIDTGSDLNPGSNNDVFSTPSLSDVVGGSSPQGYYLNVDLLEQVDIYDSNIPASFGGFTGGVVNARMKRFNGKNSLSLHYGIERDEWESFHVTEKDRQKFEQASGINAEFTPDYRKNNYQLSLQQGLGTNTGLALGLSRRESSFSQNYTDALGQQQPVDYQDSINNLHGRIDYTGFNNLEIGTSLRLSEREHDGITSPRYADRFSKSHRGIGIGSNLEYRFQEHLITLDTSVDMLSDTMKAASRTFEEHESREGTLARQTGGFGDVEQQQTRISLAPKWQLPEWQWGNSHHQLTLGGNLSHTRSYYERPEDVEFFSYACVTDASGANGCADQNGNGISDEGDEYLQRDATYGAGKVSLNYVSTAIYLDQKSQWHNWSLRYGLRADHNNWLKSWDLAPRFSADWDLLGDGNTRLQFGANRYYGRSFLRYAVNDAVRSWNSMRFYNKNGDVVREITYDDRSAAQNLETPYADEFMLGWVQHLGPVDGQLKLVRRESEKEIIRKKNNEGLYAYVNSATGITNSLTLEFDHERHPLELAGTSTVARLGFNWKNSTSSLQGNSTLNNGGGYDDALTADKVYYQGRLVSLDELPAWDYNTPFSARLTTITQFPAARVTWSNFLHYRQGSTQARDSGDNWQDSSNTRYDIYEDVTLDSLMTLDSRLQWRPQLLSSVEGYLMFEVSNLFDEVIDTSTSRLDALNGNFSAGRKFWLEAGMKF
ncbi:TonB-dependent receptor plug domain-containing protein [Oceanimonas baumannii]|uniref:Outer membrane receptor protein involved in Fe transport n=1 Tax=Oceanimonas baumannii TaxID=129578 RepID=A0A235CKG9_9GAMM|nr:TonB-dependent receptor plug domain-containing protein [Oceanimonas baumannii]OYD25081.1 hypothetical protein B6S09_07780 [Oceanimonas baumannii]TDW59862.1 outer membrane receptor protein involved in Fe transport [Oceanimonas baumannii]